MTTIYFVRHGDYENPKGIAPWRLPGFPLSEKGRNDMLTDALFFKDKNIAIIFSSPILRCRQTAEITAKEINKKIIFSKFIIELYTPFQNKNILLTNITSEKNQPYKEKLHVENKGESVDEIYSRLNRFVKKVLKTYKK